MAKLPILLSFLLLLCNVFSSSAKTTDSLVYSTYLQWDSISSEVVKKCGGTLSLNCLERQLGTSKDVLRKSYLEYELIKHLERSGKIKAAEELLIKKVNEISPDNINYFEYRFLDLGLSRFVLWDKSYKAETCLHQITNLFNAVACDSIFDVFTTYRKGGELYIIHLVMPLNAEVYFQKALSFWEENFLDSAWLPPLFYDFAALRNEKQEFEIAKDYLIQAEKIAIRNPNIYGENFLNKCKSLLSTIYAGSHKTAEAIALIKQIIEGNNSYINENYEILLIDYLNLISYLILENRFQESLIYINTVERFYDEIDHQDASDLFNITINKSKAYEGLFDYKKAWEQLDNAEAILELISIKQRPPYYFTLLMNKAKLLIKEGKIDAALSCLLSLEFTNDNSTKEYLKSNQGWQIEYFILNGDLLSQMDYEISETSDVRKSPIVYYNKADSVINQMRTNNSWRNSSAFLVEHYRTLTEKLIGEYYNDYVKNKDQKNLKNVFNVMERNQALLINERIKQQSLKVSLDIDSDAIQIGQEIELLENKIAKYGHSSDKIKLDQLNKNYSEALNNLEANYSRINLISLDEWKVKLKKENTNWISYFQGDNTLYILFYTNGLIDFKRIDFNDKIKDDIATIIKSLRSPQNGDFEAFELAAYNLQKSLIPESVLNSKLKDLIIVQDRLLYFLPFEVLLVSKGESNSFAKADYLLRHKNIRYSLSAALWKITKIKNGSEILFALYNDAINQLEAAESEVKSIQEIWKHKSVTVTSKSDFFKALDDVNVIHVAAHAASDTNQLGKNQMYFCNPSDLNCILESYELAPYNLTDKLVVLNGCETNYGRIIQGEGIFSWVRDFAVNGALTSISNMWKVSDVSAEQIMTATYYHWHEKGTISKALQQSKLDYVNNSHPLMAHPFYWANTIVIGEASLESKKIKLKRILIPAIFTVIILLLLFKLKEPRENKL